MRILLAGGAGYIGSHTALAFLAAGDDVVVVDSLVNAHRESLRRVEMLAGRSIPFLEADLRDSDRVEAFIDAQDGPIDAVVHFAGLKSVADSVADPLEYYDVNLSSTVRLLRVMRKHDILRIVFSSSATVYGDAHQMPVTERSPTGLDLANPYGKTKRIIEEILNDACAAQPCLAATSLRYFNPVGADPRGLIGEDPTATPTNLMPLVARVAMGRLPVLSIYGNDYPTPDGTGLRDYIHVCDLAEGHVAALHAMSPGYAVYNLGTGRPTSVLELVAAFQSASGAEVPYEIHPRRDGDVAVSYADPRKAQSELRWTARRTVEDACADYWNWSVRNPAGFSTN